MEFTQAILRKEYTTGGPTPVMAQELESLLSRLDHQHTQLESRTGHVTRLNQLVAYSAGTSDAESDAIVKLNFLNDRLQSFSATTEMDQARLQTATRGISNLTQVVQENYDATHQRIDEERSTSLRTMENLEKGFKLYPRLRESGPHLPCTVPSKPRVTPITDQSP